MRGRRSTGMQRRGDAVGVVVVPPVDSVLRQEGGGVRIGHNDKPNSVYLILSFRKMRVKFSTSSKSSPYDTFPKRKL